LPRTVVSFFSGSTPRNRCLFLDGRQGAARWLHTLIVAIYLNKRQFGENAG